MGLCRASLSATPTSHVTSEHMQARAHKCAQMPKSGRFPSHAATPNFGSITYMVLSTWDKTLVTIRLTVPLQYSETSVWGGPGSYKAHHITPILQFLEYRFLSHANYTILSMKIPTAGCTDWHRETFRLDDLPAALAKSAILCGLAITWEKMMSLTIVPSQLF